MKNRRTNSNLTNASYLAHNKKCGLGTNLKRRAKNIHSHFIWKTKNSTVVKVTEKLFWLFSHEEKNVARRQVRYRLGAWGCVGTRPARHSFTDAVQRRTITDDTPSGVAGRGRADKVVYIGTEAFSQQKSCDKWTSIILTAIQINWIGPISHFFLWKSRHTYIVFIITWHCEELRYHFWSSGSRIPDIVP